MWWKRTLLIIYCSAAALNFLYVPMQVVGRPWLPDQNRWLWNTFDGLYNGERWEPRPALILLRFFALLMFSPLIVMALRKPDPAPGDRPYEFGQGESNSPKPYRLLSPEPARVM